MEGAPREEGAGGEAGGRGEQGGSKREDFEVVQGRSRWKPEMASSVSACITLLVFLLPRLHLSLPLPRRQEDLS